MASEDDHLNLSCESSDFEEDKTLPEDASKQKTLPEDASKQFGLRHPYRFEPYAAENRSTFPEHVEKEIHDHI